MTKVEVFDPPMCCSSGVCGPNVDPKLVLFSTALGWLGKQGIEVRRYNPTRQYDAFAGNADVVKTINERGNDCLPLILVDGRIVSAVNWTQSDMPEAVRCLLPRLRDPSFSRVILVTLPEATPVHEAAQLQEELQRAGIQPFAWVVNQCLAPLQIHHALLRARQDNEHRFIGEACQMTDRFAVVPWLPHEPMQVQGLRQLTGDMYRSTLCTLP